MMKYFIAAPFGNYLKYKSYPDVVPVTGTWTMESRGGILKRLWKIGVTLRYNSTYQGWTNKLGLPNPGILVGVKKTALNEILSIGELESGDFKKIVEIVSDDQSLEINLSCPNVKHDKNLSWDDTRLFTTSSKRKYCIVKVSPLITIDELKFLIEEIGFKQIHCCNTLPVREGGLSGKTLRPYVNKLINIIRDNWGDSIEIIAGGGVENIQHVDDYLTLGADHISLGTICFTPWRVKALINKRD